MRELTIDEMRCVGGGDFQSDFNQCMAENWWEDTLKGAIGGAVGGAWFGGVGAGPGAIIGANMGSLSAAGYCFWLAL